MLKSSIAFLLVVLMAACGGKEDPTAAADDGCGCACSDACGDGCGDACGDDDDGGMKIYSPDKATATISGTVKFDGKAPRRRPIDMGAEKYCKECYKDGGPALTERIMVGEGGALQNVYVTIKRGLRGWKFPKPTTEALLDQVKCAYVPHVLAVRVGQTIKIRNSDPIMHNVHATPYKGQSDTFNMAQTQKGQVDKQVIKRAGMYAVKCDVHGWMSSFIGVSKHPFSVVTGADGKFTLSKVPAGEYTIEAWHEKFGTQTAKLTVKDGGSASADFTFKK